MFEHKNWKVYAPNTDVVGGGGTESVIQPKTRFEYFLDKIAKALGGGEGGTGGGSFVIHVNETTIDNGTKYELDKTWQEVSDAIEAGMYCCIVGYLPAADDSDEMVPSQLAISGVFIEEGSYCLSDLNRLPTNFSADTKDGYPYNLLTETRPNPGTIDPRPVS